MLDLEALSGAAGDAVMVLGYDGPGDGGGGMFYWLDDPEGQADGGRVIQAGENGVWKRLADEPAQAAWFGVLPEKEDTVPAQVEAARMTERWQRALDAAAGEVLCVKAGRYFVTETLIIPANTLLEGAGPQDTITGTKGGTLIQPRGPGVARIWQDTGNAARDRFRPLFVFGGSNKRLRNVALLARSNEEQELEAWEVGILMPSTKRCSLEYVTAKGWSEAACLLDATWSEANRSMIGLHEGHIQPSAMNECLIHRCLLSGKWGLMIRGADASVRDPETYRDKPEDWVWSPGGTSDLDVIACRIEGKAPRTVRSQDGGAYFSDAPLLNAAGAGQGHRFVACNFRVDTRFMLKFGASNRDSFFGCYFEGPKDKSMGPAWLANDRMRSGRVRFVDCRFASTDVTSHWHGTRTDWWPPVMGKD
ncbi:MAG: hypothetical protein K9M45_01335 [Kiritimatiellales bacterium]|nr:hypothetical protein [Kiritimatiellales bacterium]